MFKSSQAIVCNQSKWKYVRADGAGKRVSEGRDFFPCDFSCATQKYLSNNKEKTREVECDNEPHSLVFMNGSGAA